MTEVTTETGFTFTREGNEVFAEILARKPDDLPLADWVAQLMVLATAARDKRLVWYWDRDIDKWVPGMIVDDGAKDGYRVFDVDIFHGYPQRWGYEWQVVPFSSTEPAPPDLSKVAP